MGIFFPHLPEYVCRRRHAGVIEGEVSLEEEVDGTSWLQALAQIAVLLRKKSPTRHEP